MILTDREIQIALSKGQIVIDPSPAAESFSSTSVDLTLDARISVFKDDLTNEDGLERVIDPKHRQFNAERTIALITSPETIKDDGYLIQSKKFILGWTRERIELPVHSRLAARVEGKSSLARFGLGVHITAPTIHSGFAYPIRLEIINNGYLPIRLRPGMKICQLVFELTLGTPQKGFSALQSAPLPETAA